MNLFYMSAVFLFSSARLDCKTVFISARIHRKETITEAAEKNWSESEYSRSGLRFSTSFRGKLTVWQSTARLAQMEISSMVNGELLTKKFKASLDFLMLSATIHCFYFCDLLADRAISLKKQL